MAGKLGLEARMTIGELSRRGIAATAIARQLDVTEGAVRYHLRRQAAGAKDGRARQRSCAEDWVRAIEVWLERREDRERLNLAVLRAWLVEEHDYSGSLRSLQHLFKRRYPAPKQRARRRVETPPGAQSQADWAEFRGLRIGGGETMLYAFHLEISHSRYDAVVWSARKHELAWLRVHNEAFARPGGIPAIVRVDNKKMAVSRGAGVSGTVHPAYGRYATMMRFHVGACAPRSPEHKGQVERLIRHQRLVDLPRPALVAWQELAAELRGPAGLVLEAIARHLEIPGADGRRDPSPLAAVAVALAPSRPLVAAAPQRRRQLFFEHRLDGFQHPSAKQILDVRTQVNHIRVVRGILRHGVALHRLSGEFALQLGRLRRFLLFHGTRDGSRIRCLLQILDPQLSVVTPLHRDSIRSRKAPRGRGCESVRDRRQEPKDFASQLHGIVAEFSADSCLFPSGIPITSEKQRQANLSRVHKFEGP